MGQESGDRTTVGVALGLLHDLAADVAEAATEETPTTGQVVDDRAQLLAAGAGPHHPDEGLEQIGLGPAIGAPDVDGEGVRGGERIEAESDVQRTIGVVADQGCVEVIPLEQRVAAVVAPRGDDPVEGERTAEGERRG